MVNALARFAAQEESSAIPCRERFALHAFT
jgi:hypothetical protein